MCDNVFYSLLIGSFTGAIIVLYAWNSAEKEIRKDRERMNRQWQDFMDKLKRDSGIKK